MHQPFYKDLWSGQYKLPWTRLHALKDYAGMVEILREFPRIHQTFNLVPSVVAQIEEYAAGTASDPFFDCAVIPAEDLTESQRVFMRRYFFQANLGRVIYRYPRYRELYESRDRFTVADLRDLQVLSQLAWFDEDLLARDPELMELVRKGRDYSLQDQAVMVRKQRESLQRVLPVYRDAAASGQIEISTTPFYHPILPLICDSDIAAVSRPGVTLPRRFCYPEDAREQLTRARNYMRDKLGVAPVGLWPSEGSISDEALGLAVDCGFKWAASDNGVLARTLGANAGPDVTYRNYLWHDPLHVRGHEPGREIQLLFRDHSLSDLIGFQYQHMSAEDAAGHFLGQIRNNITHDAQDRGALVPIILDGENAWEWYQANGRPFLRALYRRISDDPNFESLAISEALAQFEPRRIAGVVPGSWINANFDVWIGAEEDNLAWEFLLDARRAYDEARNKPEISNDMRRLAYEELLIAEGSDWCWWYGPEHGSDNRPEFDQLYRAHLSNVYRALGQTPPEALSQPILKSQPGELHEPPQNSIHAVLDGEVTSFFEWLGAGHYRPDPRSGSMHGDVPVSELFYGTDGENLFVRIDQVKLDQGNARAFKIEFETGVVETHVALRRILELSARLIGQPGQPGQPSRRFRIAIARDGLPPVTVPADGWIELKKGD
jgi:alpha-amylase/alpha-mannosidase (GH57 family)